MLLCADILLAELLVSGTWLADVRDLARLEVAAPQLIAAAGAGAAATGVQFCATRVLQEYELDWLSQSSQQQSPPPSSRPRRCAIGVRLWDTVERYHVQSSAGREKTTIKRLRNGRCHSRGGGPFGPLAATYEVVHDPIVGGSKQWTWTPPNCGGLSKLSLQYCKDGTLRYATVESCLHDGPLHSHRGGGGATRIWCSGEAGSLDESCEFEWYDRGALHRDDGRPAFVRSSPGVWKNGLCEWRERGRLHRGGGRPAVVREDGSREWWVRGQRHRGGDRPAVAAADGSRAWWVCGQRLRRPVSSSSSGGVYVLQPLVVAANGDAYFGPRVDGGPTVVRADGTREWYQLENDTDRLLAFSNQSGVVIRSGGFSRADNRLPARELPDGTLEWYSRATGTRTKVKRPDGTLWLCDRFGAVQRQVREDNKATNPGAYADAKRLKRKTTKAMKEALAALAALSVAAAAAAAADEP